MFHIIVCGKMTYFTPDLLKKKLDQNNMIEMECDSPSGTQCPNGWCYKLFIGKGGGAYSDVETLLVLVGLVQGYRGR